MNSFKMVLGKRTIYVQVREHVTVEEFAAALLEFKKNRPQKYNRPNIYIADA